MSDHVKANVLVVDDESYICNIIEESLADEDYNLKVTSDPVEALEYLRRNQVDLVLTDLMMGKYSGVQILDTALAEQAEVVVILMTAHPTVETAISVLKKGAHDFLVKPFKLELLKATLQRGLDHQRLLRENVRLKEQMEFMKVANATSAVEDIDSYLINLARACLREMSAKAVGIIEIDPRTKQLIRKVHQAESEIYLPEVLDDATLFKFGYTKSSKPVVETVSKGNGSGPSSQIFISQPIFIRRRLHGVINLLLHRRFEHITPGQLGVLNLLTSSAASAIANNSLYQDLQSSYLQAIRGLANSIEARDEYTRGHTERVCLMAELVARKLGWDEHRIRDLIMGCTLHDIGKIGVPDSILKKPGPLTSEERTMMESHPDVGVKIIRGIDRFKPAVPYIIAHHERWDGTGYPKGLVGEDIPIEGRLLSVVDTLDAILSDRPYRQGAGLQVAVDELLKYRNTQFDASIVDIFLELIREGQIDFNDVYGREVDATGIVQASINEKVQA